MEKSRCVRSGGIILSAEILTPIGTLTLRSCAQGFHSVKSLPDERFIASTRAGTGLLVAMKSHLEAVSEADTGKAMERLRKQIQWITDYFQNSLMKDYDKDNLNLSFSDFCFDEGVTDFEVKVWKELFESVQSGYTTSYAKLAEAIQNPKAARAVGTALKKNPNLLMIPCHRIIRSDGKLGSFAAGEWNQCKEYLYNHERETLNNLNES